MLDPAGENGMATSYLRRHRTDLFRSSAFAAAIIIVGAPAGAHDGQHGPDDGHLLGKGAFGNVELVGKVRVHNAADDRVADVGVLGKFAYLAAYAQDSCG